MTSTIPQDTRRQFGDRGESLAVALLEREGYEVVDRNVNCPHGEVDIIATKEGVYCFVEVRSRATDLWGDPAMSVVFRKQRKVAKSAMWWLQRQHLFDRVPVRFDIVSVVGRGNDARVEHLPGAFEACF